jgi:hypothetical protein
MISGAAAYAAPSSIPKSQGVNMTTETTNGTELLTDLICLAEACKLIPSHRPGKRLHIAILRRWIATGRVPGFRRGRWWFVRRADIADLIQGHVPQRLTPRARPLPRKEPKWVTEGLRRHGLLHRIEAQAEAPNGQ